MKPEELARQQIDAALVAAGWVVQDAEQQRIVAEIERQLLIVDQMEAEVDW